MLDRLFCSINKREHGTGDYGDRPTGFALYSTACLSRPPATAALVNGRAVGEAGSAPVVDFWPRRMASAKCAPRYVGVWLAGLRRLAGGEKACSSGAEPNINESHGGGQANKQNQEFMAW